MSNEDEAVFAKDGTVIVRVEGETYRLRRPKTGEYRKLREGLHNLQDEITRLTAEASDGISGAPEDNATTEERMRFVMAQRGGGRELTDKAEQLSIDWLRQCFDTLADQPLPEGDDDLPVWLWAGDFTAELLGHWRERPFSSGAR